MITPLQRLCTREARKKLKARDRPYYVELRRGLHLGYRRGVDGGSWLLREFSSRAGKDGRGGYVKRRLGAADDAALSDGINVLSWSEAQAKALGADRPTVTTPGKLTMAAAAEAYFATRAAVTPHDRATWVAFIAPRLGTRAVSELTTGDLESWLAAQVPKTEDKEAMRAARATANRRWTVLRAILNSAYRKDPARVPSADAWRRVRPFQNVDRPRLRTLSAIDAQRLLNVLEPSLRALARGALYTGCRLGELQALRGSDITEGQVQVRHSKPGRARTVPLNAEGVAFFEKILAGKTSDALLFEPIHRVALSRAMRAACTAAKIVPPATFHDLRRSYGSLLLNAGAPADVIQELLGHADLRMTRRAYAHLLKTTLQKHVNKRLPSFGLDGSNVRRLKPRLKNKAAGS